MLRAARGEKGLVCTATAIAKSGWPVPTTEMIVRRWSNVYAISAGNLWLVTSRLCHPAPDSPNLAVMPSVQSHTLPASTITVGVWLSPVVDPGILSLPFHSQLGRETRSVICGRTKRGPASRTFVSRHGLGRRSPQTIAPLSLCGSPNDWPVLSRGQRWWAIDPR